MSFEFIYLLGLIPVILIFLIIFLPKKRKIHVGYVEAEEATRNSVIPGEKLKLKYFFFEGGRINLKKHPELTVFHVINGKDILVELWKGGTLYVKYGETKIVIVEILKDDHDNVTVVPCLRTVQKLVSLDCDDPLKEYKDRHVLVSWGEGETYSERLLPEENIIGVVKYESI